MKFFTSKARPLRVATVGLLLCLLAIGGCGTLGIWASKAIYPALTQPLDAEPATTFLASTPSLQLSAWIGGQGGGLSCSIPTIARPLFFSPIGNSSEINLQFRQACAMHDMCYRHGSATYAYTQADCDFALVEAAFRTCVQIFAEKKGRISSLSSDTQADATEQCRDQARQVLLGVRLGGGGSFKPAARSTYYEFDPIPDRATDYSVVRWLGAGRDQTDGRFAHIRLTYGTGQYRQLPGEWSKTYHYPFGFVPTPPVLRSGNNGDELVALARRTRRNTGVGAWLFQRTADELERSELGTWDPDSSVVWVNNPINKRIVAWKRMPAKESAGLPYIGSCIQQDEHCKSWNIQIVRGPKHDAYRTLQHPPLRGRFLSSRCQHIAIFRRGGSPDPAGLNHDTGAGFEDELGVLFGSEPDDLVAPECQSPKPVVLPVPEAFEPLGVIEMGETDAFFGVSAKNPSKPELPFLARVFRASGDKTTTSVSFHDPITKLPLTSEWIARAIAVSKQSLLGDGKPHAVLTKVSAQSDGPDGVRIDALDFQIDPDACKHATCNASPVSGASCLVRELTRNTTGIPDPDLNRRLWLNAPSIPGAFLAISNQSGAARYMQLAVFKRGSPDQSFIVDLASLTPLSSSVVGRHAMSKLEPGTHVTCLSYGASLAELASVDAN